jgi:hypothetical protein
MLTAQLRERNKVKFFRATERAKAILQPGDRFRCTRCGGILATYTFASWDGCWIVSKSGISDLAASCIDRLNGSPVNFKD